MFTVKIKNFRSFKDQTFKFSKFNILIGENSSGKSSLLKFLLALKQTLQPPSNRQSNFSFKGEYTDLGSFKDSVYYQDDSLPIKFSFEFDDSYYQYYTRALFGPLTDPAEYKHHVEKIQKYVGSEIKTRISANFTLTKDLNKHESISSFFSSDEIGSLTIKHNEQVKGQNILLKKTCNLEFLDKRTEATLIFKEVEYDKDGFLTLLVSSSLKESIESTLKKELELIDEEIVNHIWYKIAFLVITQNYIRYLTSKIQYINPINTHPTRVFLYQDKQNADTINNITDVVEFFTNDDDFTKAILSEYIEILKNFGIADDLQILHDNRLPVRELRVQIKDLISNIYDVGYGVALQLPIILKALLAERLSARRNSIIFIEQPEVHLHPKLHAQLLSILLSLSKNTIYFIETHSEHIIRKLQVDIKKGSFGTKPRDVSIHYLRRVNLKTEVTEHKIEPSGKLIPAFPDGFFDNSYNLVKDLLD